MELDLLNRPACALSRATARAPVSAAVTVAAMAVLAVSAASHAT
jgi:hypothetical protein